MARKRKSKEAPEAELPMTPMIDVVFQLLIYFIFTIKPLDVLAHLDVFRPGPEQRTERLEVPPNLVRIGIFYDGFTVNDKPVAESQLESLIRRLAELDRKQTVLIMCSAASPHEFLVRVLNLCAKYQLTNLSVISVN
jgi:biopolymer transport protein ExbD